MDTKFSTAIHTLILISESKESMPSEQIAVSVGTNASYIRKITAMLKKAGIIEGHKGIKGFKLTKNAEDIRLLDIYRAVKGEEKVHLFDIHQNPSDQCIVGKHIKPVLTTVFRDTEEKAEQELKTTTLADCMALMKEEIEREKS